MNTDKFDADLIEAAWFTPISLQHPDAWCGHLPFASWLIGQLEPATVVELGTHSGNSYFAFCQAVKAHKLESRCYAVDCWEGDEHAGSYSNEVYEAVDSHNRTHYADFSRLMRMFFDEAVDYFPNQSIDLLHIDGLHTYEAVKHDFETWLPKLAPGAVVLFHDTNVRERGFGVWQLWNELKQRYVHTLEFDHSNGLGVLQLNGRKGDQALLWLDADDATRHQLKKYFAALGQRQIDRFYREIGENDLKHYRTAAEQSRQHIQNLEQAIEDLHETIRGLHGVVAEHQKEMEALKCQAAALVEEKYRLERDASDRERVAQDLRCQYDQILNSRSWRMGRPFRETADSLRRLRNKFSRTLARMRDGRRAYQHMKEIHSGETILRKIIGVWKREGLTGIRSRLVSQTSGSALASLDGVLPQVASFVYQQGTYHIVAERGHYIYMEPQKPIDLEVQLAAMEHKPLFSIVVPIYNTTQKLLTAAISSVKAQWYPDWELILVDDASPSEETKAALARLDDPQIKVLILPENRGISGATNFGLDAAAGDYVVFMDHDDELTPDCLYELAVCIDRDNPDYIYSDEDKISDTGLYTEPHFKPDWSPDTMMSTMFVCHVSCVRRSMIDKVGGLRPEYDGCQDWDFVLRLTEQTHAISHIPKVLYHWRIIPASTASDIAAKPYVLEASQKVRRDALSRRGLHGTVEAVEQVPGYFRVNYALCSEPLISIIIPSRDNGRILEQCIHSIHKYTAYPNFEIIVLDNGSIQDETLAYLQSLESDSHTRVVRHDAPFNYSELNNIGVSHSRGQLLLFLNDDTEVLQMDWLERLGGYAQLEHVGAVGAKLIYPGGRAVQHAGVLNLRKGPIHAMLGISPNLPGYFMRNLLEYNWLAVTGACLMIERNKFERIGGFSEELPIAYNDVDLSMRLTSCGFYNVVVPAVQLIHHESVSRGYDAADVEKAARLQRDLAILYRRNPRYYQRDPFYNINLDPKSANFEVAV